jgi:hypothetical protein
MWQLPELNLLKLNPPTKPTPELAHIQAQSATLEAVLKSHKVGAFVREVETGPQISRFNLELAEGMKVSSVLALNTDIALALAVPSVNILAPVAFRSRVGIEVPNWHRETVYLSEIFGANKPEPKSGNLNAALGKDVTGQAVWLDVASLPHLLIAGTTGSGKSVSLNALIVSLLMQYSPDQLNAALRSLAYENVVNKAAKALLLHHSEEATLPLVEVYLESLLFELKRNPQPYLVVLEYPNLDILPKLLNEGKQAGLTMLILMDSVTEFQWHSQLDQSIFKRLDVIDRRHLIEFVGYPQTEVEKIADLYTKKLTFISKKGQTAWLPVLVNL